MNTVIDQSSLWTRGGAWRLDPRHSTFELTVMHRLGPMRLFGTVERLDGVLYCVASGRGRIRFAIDPDLLETTDTHLLTDGSLQVTAIAAIDHRGLGLTRFPAGPLKAATRFVVRGLLVRSPDHKARPVPARHRRHPMPANSRYRLMGGLTPAR